MFSVGPGGAWSQEASHGWAVASNEVRQEELALRKRNERTNTTALWAKLALLAPNVDENKGPPGHKSKALRGRTKEELLTDVVHAVRLAQVVRIDDLVPAQGE